MEFPCNPVVGTENGRLLNVTVPEFGGLHAHQDQSHKSTRSVSEAMDLGEIGGDENEKGRKR